MESTPRGAWWAGVRAELPILVGVIPFGMIYGALALAAGIPPTTAQAMSSVVFAGSAQFITAQLYGEGAPLLVIVPFASLAATPAASLMRLGRTTIPASRAPAQSELPPPTARVGLLPMSRSAVATSSAEPRSTCWTIDMTAMRARFWSMTWTQLATGTSGPR